jgi:hypothetical protein
MTLTARFALYNTHPTPVDVDTANIINGAMTRSKGRVQLHNGMVQITTSFNDVVGTIASYGETPYPVFEDIALESEEHEKVQSKVTAIGEDVMIAETALFAYIDCEHSLSMFANKVNALNRSARNVSTDRVFETADYANFDILRNVNSSVSARMFNFARKHKFMRFGIFNGNVVVTCSNDPRNVPDPTEAYNDFYKTKETVKK